MDADKFGNEPAAAASNDDQLRIANEVGCKEFGELWDEMACKITGSDVQKSCTLLNKCRCTSLQRVAAGGAVKDERTLADLKVLKHNQKTGSVEGWGSACKLLKDYVRRTHNGARADIWFSEYADKSKKQKEEATHRKAVAGTETQATTLVQEVAQLKEKIKDLEAELTKDKAAADRRALAIDPNNADGFDYEREDADTGGVQPLRVADHVEGRRRSHDKHGHLRPRSWPSGHCRSGRDRRRCETVCSGHASLAALGHEGLFRTYKRSEAVCRTY